MYISKRYHAVRCAKVYADDTGPPPETEPCQKRAQQERACYHARNHSTAGLGCTAQGPESSGLRTVKIARGRTNIMSPDLRSGWLVISLKLAVDVGRWCTTSGWVSGVIGCHESLVWSSIISFSILSRCCPSIPLRSRRLDTGCLVEKVMKSSTSADAV